MRQVTKFSSHSNQIKTGQEILNKSHAHQLEVLCLDVQNSIQMKTMQMMKKLKMAMQTTGKLFSNSGKLDRSLVDLMFFFFYNY